MVQNVQQQQPSTNTTTNLSSRSKRSVNARGRGAKRPGGGGKLPGRSPAPDTGGLSGRRPSITNITLRKSHRKLGFRRKSVSQDSQDCDLEQQKTTNEEQDISLDEEAAAKLRQMRPPSNWQLVRVEIPKEMAMLAGVNELININRNMVIDDVTFDGMIFFLFGDQIHEVNETIVNTRKQFEQAVTKHTAGTPLIITVIRAWNVRCPSYPVLNKLRAFDENCTYLVVRLYRFFKLDGFVLDYVKKRVIISELRPKTNGPLIFTLFDHVLGVLDATTGLVIEKPERVDEIKHLRRAYNDVLRSAGHADFLISRVKDAHTAPNASIHADMQTIIEKIEMEPTTEKKIVDIVDPPMECDAIEIALRELYRIKVLTMTVDGGSVVVPRTLKGKSLLRSPRPHLAQQQQQQPSSSANGNNNSYCEKTAPQEKSLYEPYAKMPKPPSTQTAASKKHGSRWGRRASPAPPQTQRQTSIVVKETPETAAILSDVPDEMKLKGVDAESGLVKFIGLFKRMGT